MSRLRQETTMSLKWIARHLEMGAPAQVAHLLYRQGQSMGTCENTLFCPFTEPLAWIAERLKMGTRDHLAWLLQQRGKSRQAAPADQSLLKI